MLEQSTSFCKGQTEPRFPEQKYVTRLPMDVGLPGRAVPQQGRVAGLFRRLVSTTRWRVGRTRTSNGWSKSNASYKGTHLADSKTIRCMVRADTTLVGLAQPLRSEVGIRGPGTCHLLEMVRPS